MLLIQSGQSRLVRQPVPLHGTGGRCGHGRDRGRAGERVHTLFLPCSVIYSTHSDSFSLSSEREVKNRFKTSVKYGDICRSSRCLRSSEGFFFHCFTAHVPQFIFLIVFQTEKWGGVTRRSLKKTVTFSDTFFQLFLWQKAQSLSQGDSYWLGLRSSGADGGWHWSDGSSVEKRPQ